MTITRTSPPFQVTPTGRRNIVMAQRISDAGNPIGTQFEACALCFGAYTGGGILIAGACSNACGRIVALDDETLEQEVRHERITVDSIRTSTGRKKPVHPRAGSHRAKRVSGTGGVSPVVGVNYSDVPDATDL